MAIVQLNPLGMTASSEGYIASLTMYSNGGNVVYTPDGNNQIGATGNALSALAATRIVGGFQGIGGPRGQAITLVQG